MAALAEIVTSNQSGKRPERIGIKMINSTLPGKPANCKSICSIDQSGMMLLPAFPVIPRRVHGWPCICCYGFPPARARYESQRAKNDIVYHSAVHGEIHSLPAWDTDSDFPPNCDRIVYQRRVYAVCTCGELIAARFSAYTGTVTTDHRCAEAVA